VVGSHGETTLYHCVEPHGSNTHTARNARWFVPPAHFVLHSVAPLRSQQRAPRTHVCSQSTRTSRRSNVDFQSKRFRTAPRRLEQSAPWWIPPYLPHYITLLQLPGPPHEGCAAQVRLRSVKGTEGPSGPVSPTAHAGPCKTPPPSAPHFSLRGHNQRECVKLWRRLPAHMLTPQSKLLRAPGSSWKRA
jgi:hypothetical protein